MEDKSATLDQAKQILNVISQSGASRKRIQDLFESGFLSDLMMMNPEYVSRIDRRDLRNLLGVCPRFVVEVDYNSEFYKQSMNFSFRFSRFPELYADWYKRGAGKENVTVELIPPSLINNPVEDTRSIILFGSLKSLGYRFASPSEFIVLIDKYATEFPRGVSVIGGPVTNKSEKGDSYLMEFMEFKSPGFGFGMFFPPVFGERDFKWWIAAVRI
ncbi:MAG: hypothetical protein WCV80_00405 [Candidatus Paceibacterota bacterium]|jgi:hypothetical protein